MSIGSQVCNMAGGQSSGGWFQPMFGQRTHWSNWWPIQWGRQYVAAAGTMRQFRYLNNSGGTSGTVQVYRNAVATSLQATLSGSSEAVDSTNSVHFDAGDDCCTIGNGSGGWNSCSFEWVPDDQDETLYGFGGLGIAGKWRGLFAGDNLNDGGYHVEQHVSSLVLVPGTITKIGAYINAAMGGADVVTYTFWKNGVKQDGSGGTVDTRLTFNAATGAKNSVSSSLPLAIGDTVSLGTETTGPAPVCHGTFVYVPTTRGRLNLAITSIQAPASGFFTPLGWLPVGNATESAVWYPVAAPMTLRGLFVKLGSPIGGASSATWTVRVNGAATPLTVTIANGAQQATIGGQSLQLAAGDHWSLQLATTGFIDSGLVWKAVYEEGNVPPELRVSRPPIVVVQ